MKNKEKGFAALELTYQGVTENEFTIYAFPRSTEAERESSLKLLESEEIFPFLGSDENEAQIKALLESDEEVVEPIKLKIAEKNYPIILGLLVEKCIVSNLESEETLPNTSTITEDLESDNFCDGSSRKETLKHAREAFKTISLLATEMASLKDLISKNESEVDSEELKESVIKNIRLSEKILGNSAIDLEEMNYEDLQITADNLYKTVFAVEANTPVVKEEKIEEETKLEESDLVDTPVIEAIDPTLGTTEDATEQQDDETNSDLLDPTLLEQLRKFQAPSKSGNARRSRS